METIKDLDSVKQGSSEELPSLFEHVASKTIDGFDNHEETECVNNQHQRTCPPSSESSPGFASTQVIASTFQDLDDAFQSNAFQHVHAICLSTVSSSLKLRRVSFNDEARPGVNNETPGPHVILMLPNYKKPEQAKFHSQSISYTDVDAKGKYVEPMTMQQGTRIDILNDKQFNSFKTWSGELEKQISYLLGNQQEIEPHVNASLSTVIEPLPVERYFDALEGPELDTLRESEELILPEDRQWPFLLRFPISSFAICLGMSSQAILWKRIATSASTRFLHVNLLINLILWCISVVLIATVSFIYSLKIIFYFEAVRRECYHPIRINFFFAPWTALLFLALGVPPSVINNLPTSLWYVLMTPIFILELKIYGQWMSGGPRRLSKVANPSNHLAIVGNFVGSLLGSIMGLKEGPIFFFAIGLAHYAVLFVTLYQRLPTNEVLPKELHPVFFLFVAAPSIASMAWARIQGSLDYGSRMFYFIALFLYFSLAVRINLFRGLKFSLSWWAYTFPMTAAAMATVRYTNEVMHPATQALSVILSAISSLTVAILLVSTFIHAFVLRDLFPNDSAIAISRRRKKDKSRAHDDNHQV